MTTYTWDIFSSLDGHGSYDADTADWGGYFGKQGPELLERRLRSYSQDQRLILGARTYSEFSSLLASGDYEEVFDPWVTCMVNLPTVVISSTLTGPLDWSDASLESGDAVEVVAKLKTSSQVPLRSHGSIALNASLLNAGLIDEIVVTLFPALTGASGNAPIWATIGDFDLDLVEAVTLDGRTQELTYRPTVRMLR